METLEELRKAIDAIDAQIMTLIDSRIALARRIGKLKRDSDRPVEDPAREKTVLDHCEAFTHTKALKRVYRCLLEASKDVQRAP